MSLDAMFPDTITHWAVTPDGYGGYTFAAPASLKGKWEDRIEEFQDANGERQVSKSVVLLDTAVSTGDYIFLGSSAEADPTVLTDAWPVRSYAESSDLRRIRMVRQVWL